MSGRSTRSALVDLDQAQAARREFVQAGLDQRALAGAARAGEQHVVRALAGDELLGVAQQPLLLRLDLDERVEPDRRRHGAPARAGPRRRACGSETPSTRPSRARRAAAAARPRAGRRALRRGRPAAAARRGRRPSQAAQRSSAAIAARRRIAATAPSATGKTRSFDARADRMHAGEGAERGQHADAVAEPEARQAKMVERAPADADAGMQVAGEHVGAAARLRVMAEREAVAARTARRRRACRGARGGSPARSSWLPRTSDELERRRGRGASARARRSSLARARAPNGGSRPGRRCAARASSRSAPRAPPASRSSCRAAPARRARGSSRPCRCARRRPAASGGRARKAAFSGSSVSGWPPPRIVVVTALRALGAAKRRSATSRCSVGLRLKPERAKRCRRPTANAVSTEACAFASTVGVLEPLASAIAAQALAQLRLDASKNWFMRAAGVRSRTPARRRPSPASCRGSSRRTGAARASIRCTCARRSASRSTIWLTRVKTVCSMNSIRPSNICALLAKWR